jgi:hypothetical protein
LILQCVGSTTLVALEPDRRGPPLGCWLDESTLARAASWAERRGAVGYNVYYTLNEPCAGLARKLRKEDIDSLRGVPADVDAKSGRSLEGAEEAIARVPLAPSLIIFTGGGYQPLWLFDAALPATPDNIERVEAIGTAIAHVTEGDPVQNVDRILRVPFTLNFPNAKKRAAGRVICPSGIVIRPGEVWPPRRYAIDKIELALPPVMTGASAHRTNSGRGQARSARLPGAVYAATTRFRELRAKHKGLIRPAVRDLIAEVAAAEQGLLENPWKGADERHNALVAIGGYLAHKGWGRDDVVTFLRSLVNDQWGEGDWSLEIIAADEHARRQGTARRTRGG